MKPGSTGGAKLKQRAGGIEILGTLDLGRAFLRADLQPKTHRAKTESRAAQMSTLYAGDLPANEFETVLDEEDGLQRPTICTSDLMFTARKTEISQKRGWFL